MNYKRWMTLVCMGVGLLLLVLTFNVFGQTNNQTDLVDIGSVAVVIGSGLFGTFLHYVFARYKGRRNAKRGFVKYLIADNPKNGSVNLMLFAGSMSSLYSLGQFDLVNYQYFIEAWNNGALYKPTVAGMVSAFMAGWISDGISGAGNSKPVKDDLS